MPTKQRFSVDDVEKRVLRRVIIRASKYLKKKSRPKPRPKIEKPKAKEVERVKQPLVITAPTVTLASQQAFQVQGVIAQPQAIQAQLPAQIQQKQVKPTVAIEAIKLPSEGEEGRKVFKEAHIILPEFKEDLSEVEEKYPLIVENERIFAYAHIVWDDKEKVLIYRVIEPELDPDTSRKLEKIKSLITERIDVDFTRLTEKEAIKYLDHQLEKTIRFYDIKLTPKQKETIKYYIHRDFIGLEKIEPLMRDPNIEDISCDGVNIPIYVYHRNPMYGSLKTNIVFKSHEELDGFVMKLAQRCGRAVSVAEPLLDGTLPDGSRVQATYGKDIARRGSSFTIRKFRREPLTPTDLLNFGTADEEMLAYLWLAIEYGKSILVAGPTAAGKTSFLNALSLFIRPEAKIVSIEDTAELKLPHENWLPQVSREGFGPRRVGEVSMFDLLKASLRQRPDYIIVGEVRGKEAYVLFQQMATGHAGMSTIHADSIEAVINRLKTPPINLPPSLVQSLDILVIMARQRIKGRYVRRVKQIVEIVGYDLVKDFPIINEVYKWIPAEDKFKYTGKSHVLAEIRSVMGISKDEIAKEIYIRAKILKWMRDHNVRDYRKVAETISEYYASPQKLLKRLGII